MSRRIAAAALVLLLPLTPAVAAAEERVAGAGTANTSLDLAALAVTGLPLGGLDLGGLTSYASNLPDTTLNALGGGKPFAMATLRLPAGNEVSVRSDGNTGRPGERIDLAGAGTLVLGDLLAVVDGVKARSTVNALTGTIDAGLAGLTVQGTGASSLVDHTNATATNGAVIDDLSLQLTDLLPLDLLRQLPLGTLLDLAGGLDLDLPAALAGILRDVRDLAADLDAIDAAQGTVDDLQDQLADLAGELEDALGGLGGAAGSLKDQVAGTVCNDGGLIDTANDAVGKAEELLGAVLSTGAGGTTTAAQDPCEVLEGSTGAVDDLNSAVGELNSRIDELQDALDDALVLLNSLLDDLLDLLEDLDLGDLLALIGGLIDGLAATELLAIDHLSVGVTTVASSTRSSASVVCDLRGLRLLGQARANTCAALEQALGELTGLLDDLLSDLPIVGTVTSSSLPAGALTVRAPRLHSTADNTRDGSYYVATAGVEGLHLSVASLQLTRVVDDLVGGIRSEVDGLVDELAGLTGITVDLAALDALLDELLGALAALPTGEQLAGASTPGLDVNALDVVANSRFSAQGAGITPVGAPPAARTPPPRTLPATGGGVGTALLLLLSGGGALWWVRRRPGGEAPPGP